MADLRGVVSLNEVFALQRDSEWEDPNNVWIFPDDGGPEYKFIDGTVTPAPAATPIGPNYERIKTGYLSNTAEWYEVEGQGYKGIRGYVKGIYTTDDHAIIVTMSTTHSVLIYKRENMLCWDPVRDTYTISDDPDDYPPGSLTVISFANAYTDTSWGRSTSADAGNQKICIGSDTGAHIWNYDGTGYVNITRSGGSYASNFGKICFCGNGKVAIGNPDEDRTSSGGTNWIRSGAVYVYNLDGTGEFKLQPSEAALGRTGGAAPHTTNGYYTAFGSSVAISNSRIIVGATGGSITFTRRYNGEVFTYKLDGTNETWHFAQDPDLATNNYGNGTTDNDKIGDWVYAKDNKWYTGTGLCDEQCQQNRDNSGVMYSNTIPAQSSTGEYIMPGVYKDWAYNDLFQHNDYFGDRVVMGRYKNSPTTNPTSMGPVTLAYAPGANRIYWKYGSSPSTGYWNSDYTPMTQGDPYTYPPADIIDRHLLSRHYSRLDINPIGYDLDDSSQMMHIPPLL